MYVVSKFIKCAKINMKCFSLLSQNLLNPQSSRPFTGAPFWTYQLVARPVEFQIQFQDLKASTVLILTSIA